MTDLTDFGGGAPERPPPRLERQRVVQSPHTGKIAGFFCYDHAGIRRVYASRRFPPSHYYRKYDAYGMSESIIDAADAAGMSRVIVFEDYGRRNHAEERDVYEFSIRQYRTGSNVPTGDHPEGDPQRYVPVDDAMYAWPDYADGLFVREFIEDMRRIDWNGYDADHPARDDDG